MGGTSPKFEHRPDKCGQGVLRHRPAPRRSRWKWAEDKLFDEYRYFFYITNDRVSSAEQIVFCANDRCDQENLIEQLKNGVRAMRNPLDNLYSNWAYMVMAGLAWTLKAWCGLLLPATRGRPRSEHRERKRTLLRMEFKAFAAALLRLPCQIVRTGRRIVYRLALSGRRIVCRLLAWNPWAQTLMRLSQAMRLPLQCWRPRLR